MRRWALWSAVSSEEQAKDAKMSLKEQLRLGHEHAAKHGDIVVAEFIVPGESRNIVLFEDAARRIEAYQQFYDGVQSRTFDVFCFLNRGRLGRDAALSMAVVSLCQRSGIIPYDLENPPHNLDTYKFTADELFLGAIKSARDQNEVIELKRRHATYMPNRVRRGDFPSAPPWAWTTRYEVVQGEKPQKIHEVNPDALAAIRLIQEQYLIHGAGNRTIAEMLTAQGIPAPGGGSVWDKASVQQVVARAMRWAGYLDYNQFSTDPDRPPIRAKNRWPALISEAEAQALLDERDRRVNARRSVGSPHRFSGCVWCVEHQRPMVAEYTYSLNKKDHSIRYPREVYRCLIDNKHHPGGSISARYVEEAVRAAILARQGESLLEIEESTDNAILEQIAAMQRRIEQQRAALLKLDDALGDGLMDGDRYKRQVERVNESMAGFEAQIRQLETELRDELFEAGKEDRLRALISNGLTMLEIDDIPLAAAWFRQHLRILVKDCQVLSIIHL